MSVAAALLLMAQAASPAALPADTAAQRTVERGRLVFAYDQAAWHGTDDLLAHHRDVAAGGGGYVVDGPPELPRFVFFDRDRQRAVYVAHVANGRVVDATTPAAADGALSELDRRLIAARDAANKAALADPAARPCASKPFNTVVLPPETPDGPVAVYLLTPQTSAAAIPFGGHFRVDVDAAGRAGPVQRFTRSCLETPVNGAPKGGQQVAMVVSQIIGDRPTEIHVFAALTARQPVYVVTDGADGQKLWTVTGARIEGPRPLPRR